MTKTHLQLLESPEYFTVMSHEIVLKTLLRFHQVLDATEIIPPPSISLANFNRLLSQLDICVYDPEYGPFSTKLLDIGIVKEGSFSAVDMFASGLLLPYYALSLHNLEPSRFYPSTRITKSDLIPFDLNKNKALEVSVAPGAPLQLVTKWKSDRDPMFAFQLLHQATVGHESEFAPDGVLYAMMEMDDGLVMYPIAQLERAGGITNENGTKY
jgi:hypothetical protein